MEPIYETPAEMNCAPEIQSRLDRLMSHGGRLVLSNRSYSIHETVVADSSSMCFAGEVWACNTDPNGVFETDHGTKLRMRGRDFPALRIGKRSDPISGMVVRDLGVQGDIIGMDIRPWWISAIPPNPPACAWTACVLTNASSASSPSAGVPMRCAPAAIRRSTPACSPG